jgi:hypothetical protein
LIISASSQPEHTPDYQASSLLYVRYRTKRMT